jgi:hypothetical protein
VLLLFRSSFLDIVSKIEVVTVLPGVDNHACIRSFLAEIWAQCV